MVVIFVAALSALSFVQILIHARRTSAVTGGWSIVTIAAMVGGGVAYDSSVTGGSRWLQIAIVGTVGLATVGQLVATALSSRRWQTQIIYGFLPFVVASYMLVVSAILNPLSSESSLLAKFGPILLWAFIGIQFGLNGLLYDSLAIVVPAVLSIVGVSLLAEAAPWRACDQFKCGIFGGLLVGPFASENYLGELAAVALLIYLFTFRGWTRATGAALAGLILAATGSRTSQYAVLVGALLGLIVELLRRRGSDERYFRHSMVRSVGWASVATACAAGITLVYVAGRGSFSNRADIWSDGVRALGARWPFGRGNDAWSLDQGSGLLPDHYPHSEYLLLLFWGGVVGVALFAVIIGSSIVRASTFHPAFRSCVAMAGLLLTMGFTEAVWNPLAVDGHSYMILPVMMAAQWAWWMRSDLKPDTSEAVPMPHCPAQVMRSQAIVGLHRRGSGKRG